MSDGGHFVETDGFQLYLSLALLDAVLDVLSLLAVD